MQTEYDFSCSKYPSFKFSEWVCEDWMENHFTRHLAMVQECGCFNPCKRKTFEKRVTSRMWPSNHLLKKLEKQVCSKNKNSPKCKYTNDSNTTERRSSFAKIFIFYETLNYQNVEEKPFYDKISFMSDIGGTMGLMIGVSLLSIAEFIEVLVEYFIMMCRKLGR
ncbi:hypothetical protein SNE40_004431 [Patella caerulea]|uniref:Uncharacterized protein n=1 Tax=Patella caerulea TaxID=87958 RepID=A0AAN8PY27_PATCE